MKIAVLSYPMLFQSKGGLQVQVLETISALNKLGCKAKLINPNVEMLSDFDIVHVFSIINGNHRVIEIAKAFGRPVVLSPLIRPFWNRGLGTRAALGEWLVGQLTGWEVKSEYRQIAEGLAAADKLIALGETEKLAIMQGFEICPEKIEVIPNGIADRFFHSTPDPFLTTFDVQSGFILTVASINPHKNQLALAEALANTDKHAILIGECHLPNRSYLAEVEKFPAMRYIGSLDYSDPLLSSAYAAAAVTCLPSITEVMPLTILESLAAATPVVMTNHHCMDMQRLDKFVIEIDATSKSQIVDGIDYWLQNPPDQEACRNAVRHLTWECVGQRIIACYKKVLAQYR